MRSPTFAKAPFTAMAPGRVRLNPRTLFAVLALSVLFDVIPAASGAPHAALPHGSGALDPPLHLTEAVDEGNAVAVARWLGSVKSPTPRDALGHALLVRAAGRGHTDIVLLLLQHGADPDGTRPDGATPLGEAASEGHLDVVALLLGFGASVNQRGGMGATPLYGAVADRHVAVSGFLRRNGADPLIPDVNGIHPLMIAEFYGDPDLMASLQ
jgi:uncharacterized protein